MPVRLNLSTDKSQYLPVVPSIPGTVARAFAITLVGVIAVLTAEGAPVSKTVAVVIVGVRQV